MRKPFQFSPNSTQRRKGAKTQSGSCEINSRWLARWRSIAGESNKRPFQSIKHLAPLRLCVFALRRYRTVTAENPGAAQPYRRSFARLRERWRRFWCAAAQAAPPGRIIYRKYRVAPRLGTNAVRQRLLLGLHQHAHLTATETGLA